MTFRSEFSHLNCTSNEYAYWLLPPAQAIDNTIIVSLF